MSIKPCDLDAMTVNPTAVDRIARTQIAMIDSKLRVHECKWGRNVVSVPLELSYPGLPGTEDIIQTIVYSSVISSLKKRGFEVAITLGVEATTLYIAWEKKMGERESAVMVKLLRDHHIRDTDVEQFYQKGRQPLAAKATTPHQPKADVPTI
jgi:hypothetical protein